MYPYTKVCSKVCGQKNPFGQAHANCRTLFRTKMEKVQKRCWILGEEDIEQFDPDNSGSSISRRYTSNFLSGKRICFICNEMPVCEKRPSWQRGLSCCSEVRAAEKILKRKEQFRKDENHHFCTD